MSTTLPVKAKLAYGVGDFGINMILQTISFTYLFYLTDIFGLNPALAGLILLVSKTWDAVTDPIMGSLVDRTRSRWGQKRPYLLFGALPLGASLFLMFWNPGLPVQAKFVYALITFMLFCSAITLVNIPYAALTVSMTPDPVERTGLTSWRMAFALAGTLLASVLSPLLTNQVFGGGARGHAGMALVVGLVATIAIWTTFVGVKERVDEKPEKVKLTRNIGAVFVNKPFLVIAIATFFIFTGLYVLAAIIKYFFVYSLEMPGQEAIGLGLIFVSAMLYLPLLNLLSRRWGKKQVYVLTMVIFMVGMSGIYFFGNTIPSLVVLFLICGVGVSAVFLMPWSIVADTIEYSEWRTGIRPEGAIYGYFFFTMKVAAATAGFLVGSVLSGAGYLETTGIETVAQPESAVQAIRLLISLIPAGIILIGTLILLGYSLNAERHDQIVKEIAAAAESAGGE